MVLLMLLMLLMLLLLRRVQYTHASLIVMDLIYSDLSLSLSHIHSKHTYTLADFAQSIATNTRYYYY
uniref:Putative secreted protein n=1 Tax=Anopheles triannulatus TaxID=58253 RepID=A0A2M4B1B6_9DIPT